MPITNPKQWLRELHLLPVLCSWCLCSFALPYKSQQLKIMDASRNFSYLNIRDYARIWGTTETLDPWQAWYAMDTLRHINTLADVKLPIDSSTTYWITFTIGNYTDAEKDLLLQLKYPFIQKAVLYVYQPGGLLQEVAAFGEKFPYQQRTIAHRDFLAPLKLEAWTETTYLLHIDNRSHAQLFPLYLWDRNAFTAQDEKISFVYGFTFGLMGLVLIYALVFWSLLRDSLFFWYAATIFTLILYVSVQTGYSHWLFQTGSGGQLKMFLRVSAAMAMFSQIQFARIFLGISKTTLLHDLLVGCSVVLLCIALFVFTFPQVYYYHPITVSNLVFFAIFISTAIIYLAGFWLVQIRKHEVIIYFMAYSTFFFIGMLTWLSHYGLIAQWNPMVNPLVVGAAVEVLVFAFAIAIKFKNIQKENHIAQTREESARHWIIEHEENLKQKIALELHDHIGSQLSFLIRHPSWNKQDVNTKDLILTLQNLYNEVRNLSRLLDNQDFKHIKLSEAVYDLAHMINKQKTGLTVIPQNIHFPEQHLNEIKKKHIYRILTEALQNTLKHAKAAECFIQVIDDGHELIITVEDNGIGMQTGPAQARRFGLRSMDHRAKQIGGNLKIDSLPGKGTVVILTVPYQKR